MGDTDTVRVVPSGKIYRQMFEAQVQLNRSLTKIPKDAQALRGRSAVPLVHLSKEDVEHGILGERQRTWADGFPNEPYIENPVVYKQYAEYVSSQKEESESHVAGREVRGLPDNIQPAKEGSNIIERIAASRKERHEASVEEMHQELSVINSEMEPRIEELCTSLMKKLEEDDIDIARKQATIEKDEDLLNHQLVDLQKLWQDIATHSEHRQQCIQGLDSDLTKTEDDRMDLIKAIFRDYAKALETIAHILSPDLHRFMDKESQLINQTVLSNRRAYGDLFVRLMSTDIEREKNQHIQWKRRVDDWKMLKTEAAIKKFKEYMRNGKVINPPGVQKVIGYMVAEQEILNNKRLELIRQLLELKPPSSTKTSVYNWNKGIQDISQEIDACNQLHLSTLHKEYESVCQTCLEEVDAIKLFLVESGVCVAARAQEVVDRFMIPLIGDRQRVYESSLESMEKSLEDYHKGSMEELKLLFKFAQGAAHVWDVHEIGLARQERALQEKLEQCRQRHDNQNQNKEALLDIVMDRMRQDATEKSLKDSLTKALDMLDKIRAAYEVFHKDQTEIVKKYPEMVDQELKNYDSAVCRLFTVDRNFPSQPEPVAPTMVATPESGAASDGGDGGGGDSDGDEKLKKKTPRQRAKEPPKEEEPPSIPMTVSEVLSTDKRTTFYVLVEATDQALLETSLKPDGNNGNLAFMTEVDSPVLEESHEAHIKNMVIPTSLLVQIKRTIRMNFLNQMEEWTEQALERAAGVVVAKTEEMNSELDLRLHLHKPRARRAEYDVHNVRAAELVMHSERVTRHCKGILQALIDIRTRFSGMTTSHNKLATKFRSGIEALEVVFINATKASRLYGLKNQLNMELEKFMSVIRASLRNFRQTLDETLQMLRESNARFIKSFKVFSDGGNFCPEEIDEYRKRLEKMSQKIDQAEGSIMSDLEGMESKRLEQATKIAVEFEDRFKSHMFDLIFMEKIARWLTNTQVKIKAEVANSNTQAQQLGKHLNDLDRRIDACEKPNLDKEQITSAELNETLPEIFEAFHTRSVYLNSLKEPAAQPSSEGTIQPSPAPPPATAPKVAFVPSLAPTPISKAGRQPTEDPSVSVIKNIMKQQKTKLRFGIDADLDGEYGMTSGSEARDKMKSSMSNNTSSERGKTRPGMSPGGGLLPSEAPRKTASAVTVPSAPTPQPAAMSKASHTRLIYERIRRANKPVKYEKRNLIFGDNDPDDDEAIETHFLGLIRHTLKETLDGLLGAAELYYRQKGVRPVTRPQALQDNFDLFSDVIVAKLQSYYQQADEYHNQCLQEFRSQLTKLEQSVAHVPSLLIHDMVKEQIEASRQDRNKFEGEFSQALDRLQKIQMEHQHTLRPNLGHPHKVAELTGLCQQETERHEAYQKAVEDHFTTLENNVAENAKLFVDKLVEMAEAELLQFDNMLVNSDVVKGRVEQKKYPTSELIRRRNAGEALDDDEDKDALPRGKNTWKGIPKREMVARTKKISKKLTTSVNTAKTTLGHSSTVAARDEAYEEYKQQFKMTLQMIEEEKQRLLLAEHRWMESWNTSVDKVKELY